MNGSAEKQSLFSSDFPKMYYNEIPPKMAYHYKADPEQLECEQENWNIQTSPFIRCWSWWIIRNRIKMIIWWLCVVIILYQTYTIEISTVSTFFIVKKHKLLHFSYFQIKKICVFYPWWYFFKTIKICFIDFSFINNIHNISNICVIISVKKEWF